MISYNVSWKPGCCLSLFMQPRAKQFVKVFSFTFSLSTELLEDKQMFKLGGVDTSPTYLLFLTLFLFVLDPNLHDLDETNPGLTLFSAKLPWCCFCVEIKVLVMEWNFARNFYIINKNLWSQDLSERGPWVGTTHQVTPPSPGAPRWVVPTWWPRWWPPWYYKITLFQKKSGRKNYRDPRDGAAITSCSSSGGHIWSLFGASERGIFVLRHHQPFSIANSMMLPTGSE